LSISETLDYGRTIPHLHILVKNFFSSLCKYGPQFPPTCSTILHSSLVNELFP